MQWLDVVSLLTLLTTIAAALEPDHVVPESKNKAFPSFTRGLEAITSKLLEEDPQDRGRQPKGSATGSTQLLQQAPARYAAAWSNKMQNNIQKNTVVNASRGLDSLVTSIELGGAPLGKPSPPLHEADLSGDGDSLMLEADIRGNGDSTDHRLLFKGNRVILIETSNGAKPPDSTDSPPGGKDHPDSSWHNHVGWAVSYLILVGAIVIVSAAVLVIRKQDSICGINLKPRDDSESSDKPREEYTITEDYTGQKGLAGEEMLSQQIDWGEDMLSQQPVAPSKEKSQHAAIAADTASGNPEAIAAAEQAVADAKRELDEAKAAKEHRAESDVSSDEEELAGWVRGRLGISGNQEAVAAAEQAVADAKQELENEEELAGWVRGRLGISGNQEAIAAAEQAVADAKQELEEVWGEEMLRQQPVAPNKEKSLLAGQAVLSADIASSDQEAIAAAEQAMADAKQELEGAKAAKEHEAKSDRSSDKEEAGWVGDTKL